MSLIMAFPCVGGIVLAADSRSSTLDMAGKISSITDDSIKLLPVREDMGVLTHGIREIGFNGISALSDAFPSPNGVLIDKVIARATAIFLHVDHKWNRAHPDFTRSQGDVGFLLAGFDTSGGRHRIFSFSNPGYLPREINRPYAIEGKWLTARKLAQQLYKDDLSIWAICSLTLFFIKATADTDPSVGGPAQIAILSLTGGYMTPKESQNKMIIMQSEKLFRHYKTQSYS